MNKQKLRDSLHYRVRLSPVARCKIPGGPWLPKIDRDWLVQSVDPAGIVHLSNPSSGHVAILGHDRIHHFEYEPHRDGDGVKHGMYILRTQLVIHGNEIHYRAELGPDPLTTHFRQPIAAPWPRTAALASTLGASLATRRSRPPPIAQAPRTRAVHAARARP